MNDFRRRNALKREDHGPNFTGKKNIWKRRRPAQKLKTAYSERRLQKSVRTKYVASIGRG